MFDYLIVGSGLFGSVFAREMTDRGKSCLVIEKRNHIGGNVYTERKEGINIHKYGPHIFHTNDDSVWQYINRFATFNHYRHKAFVRYEDQLLSFPINLLTLYQIFGIKSPSEAEEKIKHNLSTLSNGLSLEEWSINQVGEELYKIFIKGYTEKQWGRSAKDLPSSIIRRIPIRTSLDNNYFDDIYQGIPIGGYTEIIERMLAGVEVRLNVDFLENRTYWESLTKQIVYTGPLDALLNYEFSPLEYRSLKFEESILDIQDFQGTAIINYTEKHVPYTRIIEHKHFEFGKQKNTVITKEYPETWQLGKEPFYPINDKLNGSRFLKYKQKVEATLPNYIIGGRLGEYKYYDMHQVIASALKISKSHNYD
jgi:UDP-galactopyranose mutase